jgi:hypothetical protein
MHFHCGDVVTDYVYRIYRLRGNGRGKFVKLILPYTVLTVTYMQLNYN